MISNSYAGVSAFFHKSPKNMFVVYNGLDLNRLKCSLSKSDTLKQLSLAQNYYYISMFARLDPGKDYITFLNAARQIIEKRHDVRFLIVGQGPCENQLREYIVSNNLKEYVFMLGYRSDVAQILSITDIALLLNQPEMREGLSNAILEAQAMQVPVIATDAGGNSEIIENSVNGFLVPPCDATAIAEKCLLLLNDGALRRAMGLHAKKTIIDKFSLKQMIENTEIIYEKCIQ